MASLSDQYLRPTAVLALVLATVACKREIPFDDESLQQITVYAEMEPGQAPWAHVTRSLPLTSSADPEPQSDAVVRWMDASGVQLEQAVYVSDSLPGGWFSSTWLPQPGVEYQLEVTASDGTVVRGITSVPTSITGTRLDSINSQPADTNSWFPVNRTTYELFFTDDETPGYFVLTAFQIPRGTNIWPPADSLLYSVFNLTTNDPLWQSTRTGRFESRLALDQSLIPAGERRVRLDVEYFFESPDLEIVFQLEKWTPDLYKALVSMERALLAGSFNPFVQPTTTYTNLVGGIGYLGGKSRVWVRVE